MTIKIGYKDYSVSLADEIIDTESKKDADGIHRVYTSEIEIKKDLMPVFENHVIIHESIHGLEEIYDIHFTEKEVDLLATGFISLLQDNPDLFIRIINKQRGYQETKKIVKKRTKKV
jgi:hypothetical protein